ncbi:MAG: LAGLIDADG family homing endonuclease [Bacteroidota bacterium]
MWSRKFDKCIDCGTTEIKHVAKGLCIKCYTLNTEAEHKKHQRHKRGVADIFLTKEKLIELYIDKGMSFSDIGRLAGCTRGNVYYKLKKFGIDSRSKTDARTMALDKGKIKTTRTDEFGNEEEIVSKKIRYNKTFFKNWSAEMAYVLGLIYTDGNLHIRKAKSSYELGVLSFAQKEKELVEKFLNLMGCDATIRFKEKRELKNTTAGELYYFSIGNNDVANDLLRLGITPNKSLDMEFPKIPDEFLRHFVRGFFDGDGSVYLEYGKSIRVKLLSGSKEFIIKLNSLMTKNGFSERNIYGGTPSTPNAYFIRYNSDLEALKFYNYIYNEVPESLYLIRKKYVFEEYFDIKI